MINNVKNIIKNYCRNYKLIEWFILISFITLALFVGSHHEPWSDEAQAWLLARDKSYIAILFQYSKYEGSPCLWHFILKTFILLGLKYEQIFLVPIIFSSLGVYLIIFKSNFPKVVKLMLPFTYYIFYQYTIIARSYCLVFPVLCLIAVIYKKRYERPYLYSLSLIILSSICLHTLITSGMLLILYIRDCNNWRKTDNKLLKHSIFSIFLTLSFITFTIWYTKSPSDISFIVKPNFNPVFIIFKAIFISSNSLITTESTNILLLFGLCIFISLLILIHKSNGNLISILFVIMPILLFLCIFYFRPWHIGLLTLLLIFSLWCFNDIDFLLSTSLKIKLLNFFIIIILGFQIYWTISSSLYDIYNNYSASKQVALFLKENKYNDKNIYGLGFMVTAIEPYFEKNIFSNYQSQDAFYSWSKNNNYLSNSEIVKNNADIVIISEAYKKNYVDVVEHYQSSNFKQYLFYGHTYIKDQQYESESYIVFVKNK